MKIGLIDVDGHNFPNLALMKISAYHKAKGDQVEWVQFWNNYDKVYKSKIFTYTKDRIYSYFTDEIIVGGTGYNLKLKLSNEIESVFPDYSIYPEYNYAIGYMTRGCPRNCPFCIVGKKEGLISKQIFNIDNFWNGQKEIKLLDPNLIACKDRVNLLKQLQKTNALIDFTQGLDIRFINNEIINLILNLKIKTIYFAYDRMNQSELIEKKLIDFQKLTGYKRNKISVYILTNFETSIAEDIYRINFIKALNFQPYIMIYNKHKLKSQSIYYKLQQWINNPAVCWKYDTFEKFKLNYRNKEKRNLYKNSRNLEQLTFN